MKRKIILTTTIVMLCIVFVLPVYAYDFGNDWKFNWCTKCNKLFKHAGKDIKADSGRSVYFTDSMIFVKKGSDGDWKEYLVARNDKNTYTYVVWHLSGIPDFKKDQTNLKGKFIGKVANLGNNSHVHVGFRDASYNNSLSMKGALPACKHNAPKYPEGKNLPLYPEKFDVPRIRVQIK